jgi:hypothetical protein
VLVGVLVLVVGIALTGLLVRRPDVHEAAEPVRAAPAAAGQVVAWLAEELPAETAVTASDAVRRDLQAAGAAERVGTRSGGAVQVVEGDPPDGTLVLARFPSDDGDTLSVVDPAPVAPTAAERERQQGLVAALLANRVAGVTGSAASRLREGKVDARLLGLLAALVGRLDVHVAALPPAPAEPPGGLPARRLLVDRAGGEPLTPGTAAAERVVSFIEAQRPPFAPDAVEQTDRGVLVRFTYVSAPDGVVTAGTS